ncbi:putative oxidoreductase [Herbihabitans rhizosphaerae]|uniref:Putative oxidoreductase n=1 Tax=Herbihabitans rhizosphaerae TaxID=1872711 RepID=A0A4Q7KRH9_9PSEU|nr:DoxX family protein [Herbihabitans rhizosphaerae]RZS39077.1 putative oxidoreductase [Herbihabitans rhizosphaerae]
MSNEDYRPASSGGYRDDGPFPRSGEDYSGSQPTSRIDPSEFDDSGYSSESTDLLTSSSPIEDEVEQELGKPRWHSGADLGLLVLRLVLGGAFLAHGLQKVFGLFPISGIKLSPEMMSQSLQASGYKQPELLAWVLSLTELSAGALLILGLLTPLAAAGIVGVMINAIADHWSLGFFGQISATGAVTAGWELNFVLAGAAVALMFTGPGRISIDRPLPWYRKPIPFGFLCLVVGVGAALLVRFVMKS